MHLCHFVVTLHRHDHQPLLQYIALIHCMNLQTRYLLGSEMGKTITVKVLLCSSYLGFVSNLFSHERASKLDTCPSVNTYFWRVLSLATDFDILMFGVSLPNPASMLKIESMAITINQPQEKPLCVISWKSWLRQGCR